MKRFLNELLLQERSSKRIKRIDSTLDDNISFIESIPGYIFNEIFSWLFILDHINILVTSKRFNTIIQSYGIHHNNIVFVVDNDVRSLNEFGLKKYIEFYLKCLDRKYSFLFQTITNIKLEFQNENICKIIHLFSNLKKIILHPRSQCQELVNQIPQRINKNCDVKDIRFNFEDCLEHNITIDMYSKIISDCTSIGLVGVNITQNLLNSINQLCYDEIRFIACHFVNIIDSYGIFLKETKVIKNAYVGGVPHSFSNISDGIISKILRVPSIHCLTFVGKVNISETVHIPKGVRSLAVGMSMFRNIVSKQHHLEEISVYIINNVDGLEFLNENTFIGQCKIKLNFLLKENHFISFLGGIGQKSINWQKFNCNEINFMLDIQSESFESSPNVSIILQNLSKVINDHKQLFGEVCILEKYDVCVPMNYARTHEGINAIKKFIETNGIFTKYKAYKNENVVSFYY